MDIEFIERLIGLVERSRIVELDYAEGGARVRISRLGGGVTAEAVQRDAAADRRTAESPAAQPLDGPDPAEHILVAGMPGTFYRAPTPGQAPFVVEGDTVEEGRTLGILEAMKMLNPVEADRAGRILRILVEDGTSVVAGTPLFAIAPSD